MNERKATKRALLTSITALVMCVVMLVGTTFAWFTDTASTAVNKIQAGNLDVKLLAEDGVTSLEGATLEWQKAAGAEGEDILWEPGCRYLTKGFRIANNGNLALKWKAQVNKGTTAANEGSFDLLDVIDFYLVTKAADGTETETALDEFTGNLKKTETSDVYYIKGVMKTTAGNDYQGLTLDGITITVVATQNTVENDSFNDQYDKDADMTPDNLDQMITANVTKTVDSTKETLFANNWPGAELLAPAGSLPDGDYTLRISPKADGKVKVDTNEASYSYDIKLLNESGDSVTAANGETFTVGLWVGENLLNVKVYHEGSLIDSTYSRDTVTFETASFSTFDVTFDAPVAIVGGKAYPTLSAAVYGAEKGATITVLRDFASDGATMNKADMKLTIDLNGHTITFEDGKYFSVYMGELTLTGTGVMQENTPNYAPIIVMHKDKAPAVVTVGKDVTLKGWSGIMINPKNAYSNTNKYAPVINVNGTLIGQTDTNGGVGAGLYVNGENIGENPAIVVNINETAVLNGTGNGIYGAGYAIYNTCGTVTGGDTGIELRAGKLNVTGGTITGKGSPTRVEANGNGATTVGAGIAVAQHSTKLPTELTVTGGEINGCTALYQSNPQKNDDAAVDKVRLSVSGGTFNAINGGANAIYSENCTNFVSGGTFNTDPTSYLATGYTASNDDGVWTVAKSNPSPTN